MSNMDKFTLNIQNENNKDKDTRISSRKKLADGEKVLEKILVKKKKDKLMLSTFNIPESLYAKILTLASCTDRGVSETLIDLLNEILINFEPDKDILDEVVAKNEERKRKRNK